jgi:recombination protein RecT
MAATKNAPAPRPAAPAPPAETAPDSLALLERSRGELARLVPSEKAVDRVVRIVRTAWQMKPELQRCTPQSILSAAMKACELGLEPEGARKHAYLIGYGQECQFQISYLGMLELARRSGAFRAIEVRLVHEHDAFRLWYDPTPRLEHAPALIRDPGPATHAYAYAILATGETAFEIMRRDEVEEIRKRCVRGNSPAWAHFWGEMAKKTVLKRFLKRQASSIELAEAMELDNQEYDLGDVTPRPGALPGRGAAGLAGRLGAPPAPEPEPEFAAGEGVARPVYSEDDDALALAEAEALDRSEGT